MAEGAPMTVVPTDVREALASSITGYATETGPSSRSAAMLSMTSSTPSGAANPNMTVGCRWQAVKKAWGR